MPDVYVRVFNRAGRWMWQVVEDGVPVEPPGPAYEKRSEAVLAATHLFPEHFLEVDEK